tara:strand:- start:927 stop:1403 length:477 start_codon:yes stop_codon:yes gene_type:complete
MAKVPKIQKKYTSGLSESTAAKRKAEFRKRIKGKDSYKPVAGDAKSKTRESKHTKKAKGIREQIMMLTPKMKGKPDERFKRAAARATGIPFSIIDEVYRKGQAAWRVGHRPSASQSAWAKARLYSFLTGGKTSKTADASLYLKAKESLKKKNSKFRLP